MDAANQSMMDIPQYLARNRESVKFVMVCIHTSWVKMKRTGQARATWCRKYRRRQQSCFSKLCIIQNELLQVLPVGKGLSRAPNAIVT